MSEEPSEPDKKDAAQTGGFAAKVYQISQLLGAIQVGLLTPRQSGLIADCRGMLKAAADLGGFSDSQPIRDRLVEVASGFAAPDVTFAQLPKEQANACSHICRAIYEIAELGNSIDLRRPRSGHLGDLGRTQPRTP